MRPRALWLLVGAVWMRIAPVSGAPGIEPAALERALTRANPGDTITLSDGHYRDQTLIFRARGEQGKPITLRAATPGKVRFTGRSSLEIKGAWLIADGLAFERGTVGPLTLRDTEHCRVTNCAVLRCNPEDDSRVHWIRVAGSRGHHNRIDHCYTEGKLKDGVVLTVEGDEEQICTGTRIDHNHFKDVVRAVRNGMETIRVGTSGFSQLDARAVVEHNLFENASGDAEIISSKSCANVYRSNTFLGCEGGLVMRHGHRGTVEGNFFFGGGHPRTAGIRIHGTGHRVINNYLSGLGQFSVSLPAGQSKYAATGHEPAIDCIVAHNTIVDPAGPAIVLGADKSQLRDMAPSGTLVANNLITGSTAPLIEALFNGPCRWVGNLLFPRGAAATGVPGGASGVLLADPRLELAGGLWRPGAGSPALGAAAPLAFAVNEDIHGQPRGPRSDIGADQRSTAPVTRRPLRPADVGPAWMHPRH
jgi:hypothetical protein